VSQRLPWLVPALFVGPLLAAGCGGDGSPVQPDADAALPDAALLDAVAPDAVAPDAGPSCDDVACEHGTCSVTEGEATCTCDPGYRGDACDELDAPDVTDVWFWIDAADLASMETDTEGRVQSWRDKGPAEHNSNFAEDEAEWPTLVPEALNGLPVVRFDTAESQYARWQADEDFTWESRYTIFMVFNASGPESAILSCIGSGNRLDLWTKSTGSQPLAFRHTPAGEDHSEVESSFGWEPGAPRLVTVSRSHDYMSIWVDGRHRVDVPVTNTSSASTSSLYIGPGLASYFDGDVAELIIAGEVNLPRRRRIENYLGAKWFGAAPETDVTTLVSASVWLDASASANSLQHASGVVGAWINRGHAGGEFSANIEVETRPQVVSGGLNGRDVVHFDGDDSLWRNGVEWVGSTLYEAYAVIVPAATGGTLTAFAALDDGDPGIRLDVLPTAGLAEFIHRWPADSGGGDVASLDVGGFGEPILVELRRRHPQTQEIHVGGDHHIIGPVAQDSIDAASLDFVLGAESATGPAYGFVGDIGELIFVQGQTSLEERLAMRAALREKWGL
jgi:hypothetical protein